MTGALQTQHAQKSASSESDQDQLAIAQSVQTILGKRLFNGDIEAIQKLERAATSRKLLKLKQVNEQGPAYYVKDYRGVEQQAIMQVLSQMAGKLCTLKEIMAAKWHGGA